MSLSACRGRAPTRGIDGWSLTSAVGSGSTRSSISSMGSRRRRCIEDGFCGGRSRRAVARRSWWRFQTKFSPQEAPVSTNGFAPSREVARAALAMPPTTRRVRASTWTEGELQHEVLVGGAQQASTVADRHGSKCSTLDPGGGARSLARDLDDGDASRVGGEIYDGRFRQAVAHRCCTVAAPNRVPSVMICGQPSKGKAIVQSEEENAMECANLSSTLQKLYLWEKKLLEEVKTVEKIRVHYEQKRKDQIKLYHGGAEAHKLEAVEIVVKKLSAKMSIAIQIVNATAKKIDNTRDEELWPQIHQFIQGFMQMWHTMSECHQVQCRALSYARCIESTMADARFNQGHMDLVKQLELQLLDMAASFAGLFNAQKRYATSMNEWLKRGIQYEPELTDDGVPPFSPGRLGAPPLFSVCNSWTVSMERISETEVVGAMQTLASNVMGLWEQHRSEWRKAVLDNSNDLERDLRSIDMDELVLRKAVEARSKKLMLATNQRSMSSSAQASEAPHAEAGLQACMNKVFEAMESFAAACENVYKDLHLRAEEEKA